MSIEALIETIRNKRCYENANPGVRCSNAGVISVMLVNRIRVDGRLRQVTEKGWACKNHGQ
jgi:hypothetical protein